MSTKRKRRVPQCARCRSHNTFASVRGHKRECQWKDCTCAKCLMVTEKRRVTAVRVAVLRRERKRRMSHRMGWDALHVGLPGPSAWGMMGRLPGAYNADQFSGNPRMAIPGEPHYNEMLHMKYRGMYHYGTKYPIYPGERLPYRNEEPDKGESGISQNLESFQHEYESFMRKLHEDGGQSCELSPSNQAEMTTSRHSSPDLHTGQRICIPTTNPQLYINRPPVTHGNIYQPRIPHERQGYLPMMLNTPLTLQCPCPVKSGEFPYGVCM